MTNNAISYTLGGRRFESKAAIKRYVQALLKSTPRDSFLQQPDLSIIYDLLKLHPKAPDKIGCGVRCIQVVNHNPGLPGVGFLVHRNDGSKVDFSYKACLTPSWGSSKQAATEAFRIAIVEQVKAFKQNELKRLDFGDSTFWSDVEGYAVDNDDAVVDHYPLSFASILSSFLAAEHLTVEQVKTTKPGYRHELADPRLLKRWQKYHEAHAKYRLISSELNSWLGDHQKTVV